MFCLWNTPIFFEGSGWRVTEKRIGCWTVQGFSLPLVEARLALEKLKSGETLEVVADHVSTESDMGILCRLKGFELVRKWEQDGFFHFLIRKL